MSISMLRIASLCFKCCAMKQGLHMVSRPRTPQLQLLAEERHTGAESDDLFLDKLCRLWNCFKGHILTVSLGRLSRDVVQHIWALPSS